MTQHLRYRGLCPINDECPKIERGREGWIEVTGYIPGDDHSVDVTIEVPDTLFPELADLDVPNLGAWIAAHHRTDLLRIQTLDSYGSGSDGDDVRRYLSGAPAPSSSARDDWFKKLRDEAAVGRIRRNLHVVREPLTPYLRYAFEWGYVYNQAAGMEIRILPVADTTTDAHLAKIGDFLVAEGVHVARMRYDDAGSLLGTVKVSADAAEAYAALAELAWEQAVDFTSWWAEHAQYHRAQRAA
jgi:hypothetical protein